MNRHPYPAYKPSGIEWLGEIPESWKLISLRRLLRVSSGDMTSTSSFTDAGYPVFGGNGFRGYIDQYNTEANTIIIGRYGALCGNVRITGERIWATEHAFRVIPLVNFNPAFISHLIEVLDLNRLSARTAQPGLNSEMVRGHVVALPPVEQQQAITAFLDRETSRLDALIEKKQRQIELLQEKRTALISRTVTKGLDPNAKMKDSGIEWLGEIPAHWETKRLKFVASIITGDKDTVNNVEYGEYPFFVRSQTIERIDSYSFDGEAVLTAGDGVGVARVFHYINGKFDFHQRVYKFSDFQSISGKFFFYYIRELFREEVLKLSAKSTVDSLRLPMIQNFVFCVPPPTEQVEIVRYIDRETSCIEKTVSRLAESITLLREYRTSLISAAVTGKIDVRKEPS